MDTETLRACPACGSARIRPLTTPGRWIGREVFAPLEGRLGLCLCRGCGLRFTNPRPSPGPLERFYAGDTYVCHDAATEDSGRGSDYLFDFLGPPSGKLLDYGCGAGEFLSAARARGWEAAGYEPGLRGRETSASRGLPVTGDFSTLPRRSHSVVTAVHVFEHLPDPLAALGAFAELLVVGGRLVLEVPNSNSLRARLSRFSRRFDERYRAFPIHLTYWSAGPLRRLLSAAGWEIERLTTVGLGLEELVSRGHDRGGPCKVTPRRRRPFLRRAVRSAFMGLGWGENLVAVARPVTPVRAQLLPSPSPAASRPTA